MRAWGCGRKGARGVRVWGRGGAQGPMQPMCCRCSVRHRERESVIRFGRRQASLSSLLCVDVYPICRLPAQSSAPAQAAAVAELRAELRQAERDARQLQRADELPEHAAAAMRRVSAPSIAMPCPLVHSWVWALLRVGRTIHLRPCRPRVPHRRLPPSLACSSVTTHRVSNHARRCRGRQLGVHHGICACNSLIGDYAGAGAEKVRNEGGLNTTLAIASLPPLPLLAALAPLPPLRLLLGARARTLDKDGV